MLVLSRQVNERIIIGAKEIVITILSIRGKKVRIGIEADEKWDVHREEIFELIEQEESDGKLSGLRGDGGHDEAATTEPVEGRQEEPGATGESG